MTQPSSGEASPDVGCADPSASSTATWQAIGSALRPILGSRGVEALYWRSLHRAAVAHPWLPNRIDSTDESMDLEALAEALAGQSAETAESGHRAVLDQFHQLLVSLVGAPLTARLLASVPALRADTPNTQETPP